MSDLLVPIVFPDYKITLETPAVVVQVPDYLPFVDIFPDEIRVPHTLNKISDLGHAGVLVINGRTGVTKYYEYGRYDPTKLGWVKKIIGLANVKIDLDGNPTEDSFLKVLQIISRRAGKSGRISAAIIKVEKKYETIVKYAERRMMMNSDPNRENYNIMTYSCLHFIKGVIEAAGIDTPWLLDPRPVSYIHEIQEDYPYLEYLPSDNKLQAHDSILFLN